MGKIITLDFERERERERAPKPQDLDHQAFISALVTHLHPICFSIALPPHNDDCLFRLHFRTHSYLPERKELSVYVDREYICAIGFVQDELGGRLIQRTRWSRTFALKIPHRRAQAIWRWMKTKGPTPQLNLPELKEKQ